MNNNIEDFGANVFSLKVMEERLSAPTFEKLKRTIDVGTELDASIADEVAEAMKEWAME
ncbi:MAG: glutamine synthetase III, partial [Lentisphaerae bacterium]|nr:glutamine synthetase III [Lentisphaerota bacterium]